MYNEKDVKSEFTDLQNTFHSIQFYNIHYTKIQYTLYNKLQDTISEYGSFKNSNSRKCR